MENKMIGNDELKMRIIAEVIRMFACKGRAVEDEIAVIWAEELYPFGADVIGSIRKYSRSEERFPMVADIINMHVQHLRTSRNEVLKVINVVRKKLQNVMAEDHWCRAVLELPLELQTIVKKSGGYKTWMTMQDRFENSMSMELSNVSDIKLKNYAEPKKEIE